MRKTKAIAKRAPRLIDMANRQMETRAQQVASAAIHFQYGLDAGKPDDALGQLAATLTTYARAAATVGNLVLNNGRAVQLVIAQLEGEMQTARNARLQEEQLTEAEKVMLAELRKDQ